MRALLVITGLLLVLEFPPSVTAEDAEWQAGFGQREVTPAEPLFLSGYASRNRPHEMVVSPLFVKAMALQDAAGHRGVLITSDIIGFQRSMTDLVCERIESATGLQRKDVIINSSHTHTGPQLLLEIDDRNDSMSKAQAERQIAWTHQLIDQAVAAAVEAIESLSPARLSQGIGVVPFVMNRREWTAGGVKLGFNPQGYVDRSVPLLRIDDLQGNLRGAVFGTACHNTTPGDEYVVSGDFAGYAQTWIGQQHPDAVALFVTGCAGSANPYPRGTLELAQEHGQTLGTEVCRLLNGQLSPVNGQLMTSFEEVELPLRDPPSREQIDEMLSTRGGWEKRVAQSMLEVLETGKPLPETLSYPLSVWQLGDGFTLVGLSGEVVGEFVPLIISEIGPGNLWVAAYCHDVFGYVPTAGVLREGGYETRGTYYGGLGFFSPRAETTLLSHIRRMTSAVGREPVN